MPYKVRTIEYDESAVSEALDSLFEYSFKAWEGQKERDADIQLQREENEFTKSQMFLEHSLDNITSVKSEISALKLTAAEHGLTQIGQGKLSDKDKTTAFQEVSGAADEEINTVLKSLNKVKDSWTGVIGNYNRGRNLANVMDTNLSGAVSKEELLVYYSENQRFDRQGNPIPEGKAFEYGIANYTLDPETRKELELKDLQVLTAGKEYKHLDQKLIDEAGMRDLSYAAGVLQNEKLSLLNYALSVDKDYLVERLENAQDLDELNIVKLRKDVAMMENEARILDIQAKTAEEEFKYFPKWLKLRQEGQVLTIDKANIEKDILNIQKDALPGEIVNQDKKVKLEIAAIKLGMVSQKREWAKEGFELTDAKYTALINNSDRQLANITETDAALGLRIFSNMSLLGINGDDVITPVTAIASSYLTEAGGAITDGSHPDWLTAISEDDGNNYSHIKGELNEFIQSVVAGKSEDLVPDYAILFDKIEEVTELKPAYESAVTLIRQSDYYKQAMTQPRTFPSGTTYDDNQKDAMIIQSILEVEDLFGVGLGVITAEQRLDANRYLEWKSTGIFDNTDLLNDVKESKLLRIEVNKFKMQIMGDYKLDKDAQEYETETTQEFLDWVDSFKTD